MSMPAEPKRRQKWSLNPREAWSQDSNKLCHKMLEKMGQSQGMGLGANEDGMMKHIKVSHKNDSKGVGNKESDDQWAEHESNFTALLEALSGGGKNSVLFDCSFWYTSGPSHKYTFHKLDWETICEITRCATFCS